MGIFDAIGGFFKAVAAVFGLAGKRSDLNNTPDMQANAEAAQIQKDRDKARADIASKDQSAIDKDTS